MCRGRHTSRRCTPCPPEPCRIGPTRATLPRLHRIESLLPPLRVGVELCAHRRLLVGGEALDELAQRLQPLGVSLTN